MDVYLESCLKTNIGIIGIKSIPLIGNEFAYY